MSTLVTIVIILFVISGLSFTFLNSSPSHIASAIRRYIPVVGIALGFLLMFSGRIGLGLPLLMMSGFALAKLRGVGTIGAKPEKKSTVRSTWLEMQLDHESGNLDGLVLYGNLKGSILSDMDANALHALYADLSGDHESSALLEAYLDRRIPRWREDSHSHSRSGSSNPLGSGPMTKQEAYQILGLEPGATPEEIRIAHRRFMKSFHPDHGGSTYLASRINQAKDVLLE